MGVIDWIGLSTRRRAMRLLHPGTQVRLALYVLGVTVVFAGLFALNSVAAYENLYAAMISMMAAKPFEAEIMAQTGDYLKVSAVLIAFYACMVIGVSVAFVNRLIGPTVALDRHLRAMLRGNYSTRIALRDGDTVYEDLTRHLNELADLLEQLEQHKGTVPPVLEDLRR